LNEYLQAIKQASLNIRPAGHIQATCTAPGPLGPVTKYTKNKLFSEGKNFKYF